MPEKRTLEPEDQIARYRVVGPLASGGMGEVYLARDETLGRQVALKVLPPRLVRSEERVRRFVTEAKSASSLNHPNIVTIYEIGQDLVRSSQGGAEPAAGGPKSDPIHFISMELVQGETLGRKIHEENTDLRTLLGWMAQAAEGLAKAHAAGIVHRDLKPGNIMVSDDGFAKVLDFGLAKLTERQSDPSQDATNAPTAAPETGEGIVLGTSGYMSPEQVQGKAVDARSDIFSMGCVLYEAATRRRPFAAETEIEVMHRILRDRPTPVEEIAPQVPSEVRRIIRRCLAKSPDQRFQSMKDLAIELREVYDEYESLPASGGSGPASSVGGSTPSMTGSGASALGSGPGGSTGSRPGQTPSGPASSGARSAAFSTGGGGAGMVGQLASSGGGAGMAGGGGSGGAVQFRSTPSSAMVVVASGRRLAIVIAAAVVLVAIVAGAYALRGRRAAETAAPSASAAAETKMSVLLSRDDLEEAVLSSDGRYLGYVTLADGKTTLNVRQVRTGSDVRILPPTEYPIHGISFSPDGDYLSYLNQDPDSPAYGALFQVASLGGTPRKIAFDVDSAARMSPDGTRICFRRGKPDQKADTLTLVDMASGKDRELARLSIPEGYTAAPSWSPDGKLIATAAQTPAGGLHSWIVIVDVENGKQRKIEGRSFANIRSVAWLPDGKSLLLTGSNPGNPIPQVYRMSYPGGESHRVTNDLSGYGDVYVASTGGAIEVTRSTDISNAWIAPVEAGREARPLTTATGAAGSAAEPVAIAGDAIALVIGEGDRFRLWRMALDGSDRREVGGDALFEFGIEYAEKAGVLFTAVGEDSVPHVWRVDADGSGLRQLTHGTGEFLYDLSRDGRLATLAKTDTPDSIYTIDPVAGGEPRLLATTTTGDPAIVSPDGTLVRFSEFTQVQGRIYSRQVFVPSAGGTPIAKLILPPGAFIAQNSTGGWGHDSKSLIYIDRNKSWNLMRQPIAGGEPAALTRFTEGRTGQLAVSPDGNWIAVYRHVGDKEGVWLVQPGKGEPRRLVDFRSGTIREMSWTADSKNVLFTYGTSGKDVVMMSGFQ